MQQSSLVGLCAALASGLLIGIERERRKGTGPNRAFAGMRSFALVAVMGALAQLLQPALVWIGALLVVALAAISHWRSQRDDPGVTTELSLFMALLLGVNAIAEPLVSAGAAVVLAALLNLRDPLHHFSRVTLTTVELRDAMFLAGALVIVLPLLPDEPARWLAGANPHRLWLLVIVVMALPIQRRKAMPSASGKRWRLPPRSPALPARSAMANAILASNRCRSGQGWPDWSISMQQWARWCRWRGRPVKLVPIPHCWC